MRIGAVFSQADSGTDPDAIRQWAIDAEAAGFDHLMAYDHVLGASAARLGPGPFGNFPAAPYTSEHTFHEILVMFSHLAALTNRMHFVTSVLVLPQRQTALVAKQVATDRPAQRRSPAGCSRRRLERRGVRSPGSRFHGSHGTAGGTDRCHAPAVDATPRRLRRTLSSPSRCRHQPASHSPDPHPGRQWGVRRRPATRCAQGRRMDALADPRTRSDRHR